jgi:hypothetical protein
VTPEDVRGAFNVFVQLFDNLPTLLVNSFSLLLCKKSLLTSELKFLLLFDFVKEHSHFMVGRCWLCLGDMGRYAAFVLANLTQGASYLAALGEVGAAPLVALSAQPSAQAQCVGAAAIRRLAACPANWPKLAAAGAVEVFA